MKLYHGSKIGGITTLKPSQYPGVSKKPVVFATSDIRFALTMIYGTGNDFAVGYIVNRANGKEEMYIDEIKQGSVALLDAPGYIYEVDSAGFRRLPVLAHVEYVKYSETPVISATAVHSVLDELQNHGITVTLYRDVPGAMKKRGMDMAIPDMPHSKERFKN